MTDPVQQLADRLGESAAALDDAREQPVAEHVAAYDRLHGELQDALAAIDQL